MLPKINAVFGRRKVNDIRTGDIQQFYNEIANRTSAANATRHFIIICAIFNKAIAWGDFYGRNPCTGVKKGRQAANRLRYLTVGEIKLLLRCAPPRLYPVLVCALLTGMRRGEILNLRWEHLDLDKRIIYILESKSGKPREIQMASQLREEFLNMGPMDNGVVFDLPVIMLRRFYAKALKDASIANFRFHDLRHTFASHYIMKTHDLPALQNILGHSTPAMTMRYAHLSQGHLASNMAAFEATMPVNAPILVQNHVSNGHPGGHQAISPIS
jgi:integrase